MSLSHEAPTPGFCSSIRDGEEDARSLVCPLDSVKKVGDRRVPLPEAGLMQSGSTTAAVGRRHSKIIIINAKIII